jgi:hypothetical protein
MRATDPVEFAIRAWRAASMHPLIRPLTERRIYRRWVAAGQPVPPPPIVKQRIVKMHQRPGTTTFIETGTYTGEMVAAVLNRFSAIITIELSPALAEAARQRFAKNGRVHVLEGNSAVLLRQVLSGLRAPALFWLDAHYTCQLSAGAGERAPIAEEIDAIAAHPVRGHVVLIDDARCFTGLEGFPTLDEVRSRCTAGGGAFDVAADIIRWCP